MRKAAGAPCWLGERRPPRIVIVCTLRSHGQGIDCLEVHHGFRAKLYLLTLLGCRYSGPRTSSAGRADRGAVATSDKAAQNCARHGSHANFGCGALAFTLAGP